MSLCAQALSYLYRMQTTEQYSEKFSTPLDDIQQEVLDYTLAHHDHAHMVSGALQGQFLRQMVLLLRAKLVLEIGTFTGFGALCLASGLPEDGELHTLELREESAQMAQSFFDKAPYGQKISLHTGDAKEAIASLSKSWDLVYLDADKPAYIEYYEALLKTMKTGSIILADNVLFHGEVLEENPKNKNGRAMKAFNDHILRDKRVEVVMLPVRDGISLIRVL